MVGKVFIGKVEWLNVFWLPSNQNTSNQKTIDYSVWTTVYSPPCLVHPQF